MQARHVGLQARASRVAGLLEHDESQVEQGRERALASGALGLAVGLTVGLAVGLAVGLGLGLRLGVRLRLGLELGLGLGLGLGLDVVNELSPRVM